MVGVIFRDSTTAVVAQTMVGGQLGHVHVGVAVGGGYVHAAGLHVGGAVGMSRPVVGGLKGAVRKPGLVIVGGMVKIIHQWWYRERRRNFRA